MADPYLVRERIEAGRRLIERLTAEGLEVAAAYWAILGERDRWSLYVVTPLADVSGSAAVYPHVHRAFDQLALEDQDAIGTFGVRVEGLRSRVAQAVIDHIRQYPRPTGNRLDGTVVGGEWAESLYAYPLPAPTPA